tara:strand:+ start:151 stop:1188 length:1038 start_codon:yes stop_codon:yes gene_type:complete
MKILFIKKNDYKLSSERIWIGNLSSLMQDNSPDTLTVKVSESFETGFDIYIVSKYANSKLVSDIKKNTNSLVGIINPSDQTEDGKKKIIESDFLICGNVGESDYYLKYNKKNLIFPLVEIIDKKLINPYSKSNSRKIIKIGYHGALEHLKEWPDALSFALEKISSEIKIKLIIVYNVSLGNWNKPNVDIEEYDWTFDEMINQMSDVDIGLVPSLRKNNFLNKKSFLRKCFLKITTTSPSSTKFDDVIQFKNNTNNGRGLVFHQLKVPVIADFAPENFIINGDPSCGYLANSKEGWYQALKELAFSKSKRDEIATNAYERFNNLYNKKKLVLKFISEIKELISLKK